MSRGGGVARSGRAVGRDSDNRIPEPEMTLQRGDHLTIIGRKEAVREAIEQLHPGP